MQEKSVAHLKIQHHLKSLIGTAILEKSFPEVRRIADVVWEEKKIVFEVQCSPITKEEVEARCLDYEKVGYRPIWILYNKNFNQRILSSAELFLRKKGAYFADGFKIYDQFEIVTNSVRLFRGKPVEIDLRFPLPLVCRRREGGFSFSWKAIARESLYFILERL